MKYTLNIIKAYITAIILGLTIIGSVWYVTVSTANYKAQYAKDHNCIWDYNDMCYTIDERPWLFK